MKNIGHGNGRGFRVGIEVRPYNAALREYREQTCLSHEDFADAVGIRHNLYRRIEGLQTYPTLKTQVAITAYLISKGLDASIDSLFPDELSGRSAGTQNHERTVRLTRKHERTLMFKPEIGYDAEIREPRALDGPRGRQLTFHGMLD